MMSPRHGEGPRFESGRAHQSFLGGTRHRSRQHDQYADIAQGYDELHKEEQVRKITLLLQNFEIKTDENLLDVGCGTGFSFDYWPTKDVTGVEPSEAMISRAPAKRQNRIFHARAEDLAIFRDHEFDVVVSLTAIHNFTDVEAGLREMQRVGKRKFAFSVLKRSAKLDEIDKLVRKHFHVRKVLERDQHDRIYLIF
jgi:ubiquinone/menaquinone biosynthesis C-methylase UbiE